MGRVPAKYYYPPGQALARAQLSHDTDREPGHHYEKSNLLLNRRAEMVGVTGANTVYHMGTISRASKHHADKNQQVGPWGPGEVRPATCDGLVLQVVDSAYGTTRSVKKVYL